ncbi:unnamed protein product, partial [Mesorhabditis spiculigera]
MPGKKVVRWALLAVLLLCLFLLFQSTTMDGRSSPVCQKTKKTGTLSLSLSATRGPSGLGNQLFEILALLGIADLTNRAPLLHLDSTRLFDRLLAIRTTFPGLISRLQYTMDSPQMPTIKLHEKGCCRFSSLDALMGRNETALLGTGRYFQSHLYFSHLRTEILKWMQPSKNVTAEAEKVLRKRDVSGNVLCVHARRGDFIREKFPQASDANFTRFATEWILKKYGQADKIGTVLLFSNDPAWLNSTFSAVFHGANRISNGYKTSSLRYIFPDTKSNFATLVLAHLYCNRVLTTAPPSTFAWFMGFLAANGTGKVHFSETYAKPGGGLEKQLIPSEFFLPDWIPLRMHDTSNFEEIRIDEIRPFIPPKT